MLTYLDIFFSMKLSKPLCSWLKTWSPCGYFFWGQTFYIAVPLPSQLPERNVAFLVLFLPSGAVLELCRIIVLWLYTGVRGHTRKHTPLPLICPFVPLVLLKGPMQRRCCGPQMFLTPHFPSSDLAAALHSWASRACMVTVKEKLSANTSKRETKSFWFDLSDTKPLVWCINWYFIFITVQWGTQA